MRMSFVRVRTEQEIERVAALAAEIWPAHYNALIGPAQVDYMLKTFQSPVPISMQIQNGMQYVLIRRAGADLGYLAYKYDSDHCFLSKLYLLDAARGKGLGRRALEHVCDQARTQGSPQLRLTVSRENALAIKVYSAWGFVRLRDVVIDIGNGYVMDDYLMQLDI